jgi:hypothetical protein
MSRRRYLSTDISIDGNINKVSDFAALLYSWMILHTADDCRISAKNAEELFLAVIPGRKKTLDEVEAAILELQNLSLVGREEDGTFFLPSESFYKYQTYIKPGNRRKTPEISGKRRRSPENAGERRETPENTASPPLPLPPIRIRPGAIAGAGENKKTEFGKETQVSNGEAVGGGMPPVGSEPQGGPEPLGDLRKLPPEVYALAEKLAGKSIRNQFKIHQWIISMERVMARQPFDRLLASVKGALEKAVAKTEKGETINSLWGYLTDTLTIERTKYMQGPENNRHKTGPIPASVREILSGIGNG